MMPMTRAGKKKLHDAVAEPVTAAGQDKSSVSSSKPQKKKQVSTKLKSEDLHPHEKVEQIQEESVVPATPEIQAEIPTNKVRPLLPQEKPKNTNTRIILKRTPSLRKSFDGRLNWKNKHYDNAFTSTPIPPAKKPVCSNKDIKTCFGFDDNDDANGSFISPILRNGEKQKPTRFNVKPQRPVIKTAPTIATAAIVPPTCNTENIDIDTPIAEPMIPIILPLTTNNKIIFEEKGVKKPKKRRTKKTIEAENEEMEKWFENQKKEFEDVENCPLMVVSLNEEPKLL